MHMNVITYDFISVYDPNDKTTRTYPITLFAQLLAMSPKDFYNHISSMELDEILWYKGRPLRYHDAHATTLDTDPTKIEMRYDFVYGF